MGFGNFIKGQVDSKVKSIDLKVEDRFYEQALTEIENDNKNKASWAKALQLTEGNEAKAKAKYIELQSQSLQEEANLKAEAEKQEAERQEAERQEAEREQEAREGFAVQTKTAFNYMGCLVLIIIILILFIFAGLADS